MATDRQSLRRVVEKWFGTGSPRSIRVARAGAHARARCRCVRVETTYPNHELSIVFFRHEDGSWNVFPPNGRRPEICTE